MKKIVALDWYFNGLSLASLAGCSQKAPENVSRDHKRRCFKRADRNGHGKSHGYGRQI